MEQDEYNKSSRSFYNDLVEKQRKREGARELLLSPLKKQIEELRSSEGDKTKRLLLYRAITGHGLIQNGDYVFKGTDLKRLKTYGIFENNGSPAQFSTRTSNIFDREYDPSVPGLPIFANLTEAISWLENKHYLDKPTLAVLDLPIDLLYGDQALVSLMRNHGITRADLKDWPVPYQQILQHIQNGNIISGEAYLIGKENSQVPPAIRDYELLLQPVELHSDTTINLSAGFQKIEVSDSNY